jgi:hypothetical protein
MENPYECGTNDGYTLGVIGFHPMTSIEEKLSEKEITSTWS